MRNPFLFIFCLFFLPNVFGQVQSPAFDKIIKSNTKGSVKAISVADLAKNYSKYVLLDTREANEYNVSHLKNALHVGFTKQDFSSVKNLDKNAAIVVYCSIGARSEMVGEKLQAQGFTNVQNLYGSIFEWVNTGHKVYDTSERPTNKVHAFDKTWGVWLKKGKKVY
jgi:rhodanese-related sulfurtransferase